MIIVHDNDRRTIEPGGVLTIGNFDGVHLGHQQIVAEASHCATRRRTHLTVMTFEPHPIAVLRPDLAPGVLTPLPFKHHLLSLSGARYLCIAEATTELFSLSPRDFIQKYIFETIRPSVIVEGHDFSFGANRAGDVESLRRFGDELGFKVVIVEPEMVTLPDASHYRVSSTLIRKLLGKGDVAAAAVALGRPYRLMGRIVTGKGKGRQLGFPTANMDPPAQVIPADGVYAGFAEIGESFEGLCTTSKRMQAVFSVGTATTFGQDQPLLLEAHILNQQLEPLAGKYLAMDLLHRLRDQIKFDSEDQLAEKIQQDCLMAREILQ